MLADPPRLRQVLRNLGTTSFTMERLRWWSLPNLELARCGVQTGVGLGLPIVGDIVGANGGLSGAQRRGTYVDSRSRCRRANRRRRPEHLSHLARGGEMSEQGGISRMIVVVYALPGVTTGESTGIPPAEKMPSATDDAPRPKPSLCHRSIRPNLEVTIAPITRRLR